MRYTITGTSEANSEDIAVTVVADSAGDAMDLACREGIRPKSVTPIPDAPQPRYEYKMVQIPTEIEVADTGQPGAAAALFLQSVINQHAEQGWEFYRVDSIGVRRKPDWFRRLFGHEGSFVTYYVITLRREWRQ
jgi:hypothetical protein